MLTWYENKMWTSWKFALANAFVGMILSPTLIPFGLSGTLPFILSALVFAVGSIGLFVFLIGAIWGTIGLMEAERHG